MKAAIGLAIVTTAALLAPARVRAQSWSSAQRLNDPGQNQGAIKEPAICAAAGGGFHAAYRYHIAGGPVQMIYRRYQAGSLSPVKVLHQTTIFGGDICEAGNGDIHVVWENWDDTPDIGWTKSSDGGLNWTPPTEITNFTNVGKIPLIAHYGAANSGQVVMSCGKPDVKQIWYNYYNGTSWAGYGAPTGVNYESEYEIFGICRSLQDGSVYRSSDNSGNQLIYQRFNGTIWTPFVVEAAADFYPRMSIAVNPSGQVMVVWEQNNDYWSKLYTPGSGWGPVTLIQSDGHYGMVTAIPGSNDFYVVYCKAVNRVRGRRWSGGGWLSEEVVSVDQPQEFTVNAQVTAGPEGTLYAAWEYWGSGNAQAWFSIKQAGPPPPMGTISGVVRDQFNVGVAEAAVTTSVAAATVSQAGGVYSMSVPAGTCNIVASKDYYAGQTINNVTVTANQTTTVDLLLAGLPPAPLASLSVEQGNTSNVLRWQNPTSANLSGIMIRYSMMAPPAAPSAGTLLLDQAASPGSMGQFAHWGLVNGTTVYYTAFSYFSGASRYYAAGIIASGTPAVRPDFDRDGDVDQQDFGHLQRCYSGTFVPQERPECLNARLDLTDNDVDMEDLAVFLSCFSGPGTPAEPICAD